MLPPPLGSFKDHAKPLVSFIWIESCIKTFETVTLTDILQIWKGVFIATQSFPPQSLAPHRAKSDPSEIQARPYHFCSKPLAAFISES